MMIDPSTLVFLDTATTGLDDNPSARVWEIALQRGADYETTVRQIILPNDVLALADSTALELSGFHERYLDDAADVMLTKETAATWLGAELGGKVLVGKNPSFDATMLRRTLGFVGPAPWHYRTICVDQLAAGALLALGVPFGVPWESDELATLIGVDIDEALAGAPRHTAEGDVLLVRAMFDILNGQKPIPAKDFETYVVNDAADLEVDRRYGWRCRSRQSPTDIISTDGHQGYSRRIDARDMAKAHARPGDTVDEVPVGL